MHTFMSKNVFIWPVDEGEMVLKASWSGLDRRADLFVDYLVLRKTTYVL